MTPEQKVIILSFIEQQDLSFSDVFRALKNLELQKKDKAETVKQLSFHESDEQNPRGN